MQIPRFEPSILTFLPTYKCTAACRECCFECTPHLTLRIPLDRILNYIDQAAQDFSHLKLVVFSGGECFLLGKDLDKAIHRAHSYGFKVRCVSNGYWAVTPKAAEDRLQPLKEAGLTELNLSTGDEHQEFVSFDRIVNAAIAAADLEILTAIVVEGSDEARFTVQDALSHNRLAQYVKQNPMTLYLKIFRNVWVSFHTDRSFTQAESVYRRPDCDHDSMGCSNVIHNMVITPDEQLASCCGLTMEHIPEMKLGSLREKSVRELYESQFDDFMKIWILVDGPEKMYYFASQKDSQIIYDRTITHSCQACAVIHLNKRVRDVLRAHHQEQVPDILFRYQVERVFEKECEASRSDGIMFGA